MTQTATIGQLKPGHEYPGANLNARSTGRDQDIDALVASITSEGILQSLLVCPGPKGDKALYVIAGNRRLSALRKMKWDNDIPVIVREDVTPGSALAMSLAENVTQCPLHPVDRFEAFAALAAAGKTEADIAAAYCINDRTVRQSLALGRLSPKIRKAWREDALDASTAKAFTLAAEHKAQDAVFEKLKNRKALTSYGVRDALVGDQQKTKRFLAAVGRDAYEAAGGKLQTDLFARHSGDADDDDDEHEDGELLVSDHALLVRLAGAVIEAKCKELVAAGWAWAQDEDDLPNDRWSWRQVEKAGANLAKEQKARSGCSVSINYNGKLEIKYGILKPGTKVAAMAKKDGKEKTKAPTTLSNALRQDLVVMAARATQDALKTLSGRNDVEGILAGIVSQQITPDRYNYMPNPVRDRLVFIRDAFDPKVMKDALQKRFDTKRYFPKAPKTLVLKAISEAVSADQAKKLAAGTKAAAWKFALANVPKTGWLPPELRTSHYDGPGAKAAPKAKPAKKKAR